MPARDLFLAACGLALLATGHAGFGERPGERAVIVSASVTQTRPLATVNSLDSRFQPDGVPVVVPERRELGI
ncbi:hypothetical protein [Desertibaculum subflavum]|uniref:hypothetical protein n=1 Tax=Desertibaculum subflavum TaxID=2268458 RepID=UPI000E662F7E